MGYPISTVHLGFSTTGATAIYSATVPGNAQSVLVTAGVATGYMTLDGSVPGATTGGHRIPLLQNPVELPVSPGGTVKWASFTGGTGAAGGGLDLTFIGD